MAQYDYTIKILTVWVVIGLLLACTGGDYPECAPPCPPFCTQQTAPTPHTSDISAVNVYFDVSGSMEGFVRPRKGEASPYIDVTQSLPHLLSPLASNVTYYRFGREMEPLSLNALPQLIQPGAYQCQHHAKHGGCNNQESRIDKVLALAHAAAPDALFVIVTDLFLSNAEISGPQADGLRRALVQLLEDGRSMTLLGIRNQFNGIVYDLPSGNNYAHAQSRPFYVLAIGSMPTLLRMKKGVDTEILSDLPKDSYHTTFFTSAAQTIAPVIPALDTVELGSGATLEPNLVRALGRGVLQVRLTMGASTALKVLIPSTSLQSEYALPMTQFTVTPQVWMWAPDLARQTCAKGWLPIKDPPSIIDAREQNGDVALAITRKASDLRGLPPKRVYAAAVEVRASSLNTKTANLNWLHEWSFGAQNEAAIVTARPPFFPTLNLAEFGHILADVTSDQFKPRVVAKFNFVFRLER